MTDLDIAEKAADLRAARKSFALVTVVRCLSPTSAKPGAKAIVEPSGQMTGWIGGGCAQPTVVTMAQRALADGKPYLVRISPQEDDAQEDNLEGVLCYTMTCSSQGTMELFVEPFLPQPLLLVFGDSPVARSIPPLARRVGFEVVSAFPGLSAEGLPESSRVIDSWQLPADQQKPSFVVVATQGNRDEEAVEAALRLQPQYLAFIASTRKAGKIREGLRDKGFDADAVAKIESPAGVDIGAVTADEIGLSVVAGVVAARRRMKETDQTAVSASLPPPIEGKAVDPVCGMSVDPATCRHRTEWAGRTFYFCCSGCLAAFQKQPDRYAAKSIE